jgi:CRP-like cAMP-binding protein
MNIEFEKFLSKNTPLTKDMIKIIVENINMKMFKKGTVILNEGDKVNECYLILKGCIRSYIMKEANEITIDFFIEEQSITPPGYGKSILSKIYLECVEDTIAAIGTPEKEAEMFKLFPVLKSTTLTLTEEILNNSNSSFIDYKISSAEERYKKLVEERPDLIQRIPQYQLAGYLGIQPESLSRIRKRISKKR